MKSTLAPCNEEPEPPLDTEASARLVKGIIEDSKVPRTAVAESTEPDETRKAGLLRALYFWVLSRL